MNRKIFDYKMWLISSLFFASGSCFAQHMNAKDGPCQTPLNTADATDCFASALEKSDSELNQVHLRVQSVVDGEELVKLKTAQRLWIQFRDANCEAEHELYKGGSAASMVKLACLEHFSFCYKLPCPIHSAFFCGMGGIPTKFRSTQFPKKL